MKKILPNIFLILGAIFVLGISFWAGSSLHLFSGFPKGVDAYAHMTRVAWILKFFPQIHWNPFWNSGTPFWVWTYPPLTALFSSVLIKIFSLNIEQGMVLSSTVLMSIGILGLYTAAWMISKSIPVSVFVSVLTVTTPAFWSWWGHGGNYARIWGLAFYFWSFAFLVWYLKKPSKTRFFLLVFFTSFSLGSHLLYGGLTFLTFGAYLLFAVSGWGRKIIEGIKILGAALLLSAYWYLPMFLTAKPVGRYVERAFGNAVSFRNLFFFNPGEIFFSLPTRFTIIVLLAVILALVLLVKRKFQERLVRAVVLGLGLGVLGSLFYILIGNIPGYPEKGYLAVFPPFATLPLLVFFSAYFLSGVLAGLQRRVTTVLSLLLTAVVLFLFLGDISFIPKNIYDVGQPGTEQRRAQELVSQLPLSPYYRFGTDSAFVADWFNYFYPAQPQTRDYIYQGIPYKRWQYFQEYVLWTQEDRYEETEWLLDWYGMRYFTVGFASAAAKHDKFLTRKDLFAIKGKDKKDDFYIFEYKKAKPILTTSDALPILVFGSIDDYEIFVRNSALAGWGTEMVIPVYGGDSLKKIKAEEIADFSIIFLYRYQLAREEEIDLIKKFAEDGGKVLVEAYPEPESQLWPSWFPVKESRLYQIKGSWNFSRRAKTLGYFSETDFGAPFYGETPWKIASATPSSDSQIWLSASGQPVILQKKVGKGEVVWSGLNLPYHAESYRNETELKILGRLLGIPSEAQPTAQVVIQQNKPHHRTWVVNQKAKGFIWRESWFPRWRVYWVDSQGKKEGVSPYLAGPSLSFIALPQEADYPITIQADYRYQFIDFLGFGTTIMTFLLLSIYTLEEKILPPVITNWKKRFFGRIAGWWEKEEET